MYVVGALGLWGKLVSGPCEPHDERVVWCTLASSIGAGQKTDVRTKRGFGSLDPSQPYVAEAYIGREWKGRNLKYPGIETYVHTYLLVWNLFTSTSYTKDRRHAPAGPPYVCARAAAATTLF